VPLSISKLSRVRQEGGSRGSAEVAVAGVPELALRAWEGSGPVVLLLHGLAHNLEVWSPLVNLLPVGCRPVAPDLRGHGRSGVSNSNTYEDFDRDVVRVLDAVGADAALLVGHSWGARVALHFASAQPSRCLGVVALDQALWDYEPPAHYLGTDDAALLGTPKLSQDDAAKLRAEASEWGAWSGVVERSLQRFEDGWSHTPIPDVGRSVIVSEARAQPVEQLYSQIACPIVMLFATDDDDFGLAPPIGRRANVEHLQRTTNASIAWVSGDHGFHVEQPQAVADVIAEWIRGRS
jgi:pimeloyl-ACP methyl ester carboxylesterase